MAIFGKAKASAADVVLKGALDAQDTDVIVVREKDSRVLFLNKVARDRMAGWAVDGLSENEDYLTLFPGLMTPCPDPGASPEAYPVKYDIKNSEKRLFSVHVNRMDWLEDVPSLLVTLRDVDEERDINKKLYNLAYIDYLTQVPNRQKLKDDFEVLQKDIYKDLCCGAVSIFDLDNFKSINDTYGHNTGDVLLRRLTEHLESVGEFHGHLYRLGGDEFVLLFSEPMGRFQTEEAMREHYKTVLSAAFLSYTMPNIELSCTLSMGVSLYPKHGDSYSDLLRKADIALYKAKESGRNCLIFFEDQYDNAKTFKDLYINIQPILTVPGTTYGYEMVDRGNEPKAEGDDAMSLSSFDRSLDALGLGDMQNDSKYFISYTYQLMSDTVQKNLPKDKFVVQIYVEKTPNSEEIKRYQELQKAGYSLCLTGVRENNITPEVMELANFIKLDTATLSWDIQALFLKKYKTKKFIATHVDSGAEYEAARGAGYLLFQGYYFEQPPVVTKKTKDIDPMKVNYLRLLKLTSTDAYVNFKEISLVISTDVALSYKLLRLLNSAAVGLRNQVSSIDMGVTYLGEENLKKWIAMLALRGIASEKPLELVRISLIRAQFGELLTPHLLPRRDARHVFLVGMLSLLHIALEKSKEELLEELPVADDIRLSLLTKTGPHSDLLQFYSDYEYSNWDAINDFATQNNLADNLIGNCYLKAVKWYSDLDENM